MGLTTDTPDFITGYFGDPFANHAQLDAHSPIRFLDKVQGAVLILHGEQDTRVPIDLGEQMYEGMRYLNKPVTMIRYPREPPLDARVRASQGSADSRARLVRH